jgi:hypothetical protein
MPATLPAQIGCLGRYLVTLIQPCAQRQESCGQAGRILETTQYGRYLHTSDGVEVRRVFHKLRSVAIEQFKGIFDGHGQVPTKGLRNTCRFALGAILLYELALLYRFQHAQPVRVGLKAFFKSA